MSDERQTSSPDADHLKQEVGDQSESHEASRIVDSEVVDDAVITEVQDVPLEEQVAPKSDEPELSPKTIRKWLKKLPDEQLFAMIKQAGERDEWREKAMRIQANADNQAARLERQFQSNAKYVLEKFLKELLTPIDNFSRAIAAAEQSKDLDALIEGVKVTQRALLQALEREGVKAIAPERGTEFDPEIHEAVMMGADSELANNTVVDCFEQGWQLRERVLRPAKVRVNKVNG